jgi:beta-glucosidase
MQLLLTARTLSAAPKPAVCCCASSSCRAIENNGVRLTHYFAWSFTDNWEWREGFKTRFGVVRIDFSNPQLPRAVKDSGRWLSENVFKKSGATKQ